MSDTPVQPVEGEDVPEREVFLREDGLLWLINRAVFHPRGYALGQDPDNGKFILYGDGSEAWSFAIDEATENQLFEAVKQVMP